MVSRMLIALTCSLIDFIHGQWDQSPYKEDIERLLIVAAVVFAVFVINDMRRMTDFWLYMGIAFGGTLISSALLIYRMKRKRR